MSTMSAARACTPVVVMLSCALLLAADGASAQGRGNAAAETLARRAQGPAASEVRARKLAELEAWLRRLVGRYRIRGVIANNMYGVCNQRGSRCFGNFPPPLPVKGMMDCVAVGSGPGVHCVVNVEWTVPAPPVAQVVHHSWSAPGMLLLSMDPDTLQIRYLQVSDRSIAEEGRGDLKGDVATFRFNDFPFRPQETGRPGQRSYCYGCSRRFLITASADGRSNRMRTIMGVDNLQVDYDFLLVRVPRNVEAE